MNVDAPVAEEMEAAMTSLSPLQIAGAAIECVIGTDVSVEEDARYFSAVFDNVREGLPPYEAMCQWRRSELSLDFGVAVWFELAPLRNPDHVCSLLNSSVRPFLEGLYEGPGEMILRSQHGELVPAFEAHIDYEPLDDNEIQAVVGKCLSRGLRAFTLLTPIFEHIEKGYVPNAEERMKLLTVGHGLWEVNNTSTDVPTDAVRFPPRLFGNINIPRVQ